MSTDNAMSREIRPCDSGRAVIPVEVKSKRGETRSLNEFLEKRNPARAYKLIGGNIGISGKKITLPHYMVMFI